MPYINGIAIPNSIEFIWYENVNSLAILSRCVPSSHAWMQRFDPHKWHCMGFYMLILDSLHVYTDPCTTSPMVTTAIAS